MKKLTKLIGITTLLASSAAVNATPLYINAPSNILTDGSVVGDTDTFTSLFNKITLDSLVPTSKYIDTNNNGFVDNGEYVVDMGSTTVAAFQFNNTNLADDEALNTAWDLNVSWELYGVAVVTGDGTFNDISTEVLGGQFFAGTLVFDLIDKINNTTTNSVMTIDVTGSQPNFGNSIGFSIFGNLIQSAAGFLFDQNGTDMSTVLNNSGLPGTYISMAANTDITGTVVPTDQGATFGGFAPSIQAIVNTFNGSPINSSTKILERTTVVGSVDITQVPEPSSIAILGLSLLGFAGVARRKIK
jgi:hypothetical protein